MIPPPESAGHGPLAPVLVHSMRLRLLRAAVAAVAALLAGCVGTTGHLAALSTHALPPADLLTRAPAHHVIGRSCIRVIFIIPTRMPKIDEAVDDALRQAGGRVLTDVRVRYEVTYLPFFFGIACYVAEGDAR